MAKSEKEKRMEAWGEERRLRESGVEIKEPLACCMNCKHYIPHYTKIPGGYFRLYVGHCARERAKNRKEYDLCEHFEQKTEVKFFG